MLEEIKANYGIFGDAVILNISYEVHGDNSKNNAKVKLKAINWKTEVWEIIEIFFVDVIRFRFFEGLNNRGKSICSTVVFEAYLGKIDNTIVIDFFALQVSQNVISEDPDSNFVVYCKEILYMVVE